MSISVIKPGLLGSIQDQGRYGYGSLGINCGGAMDRYAARVANMLVGNEVHEAVMELHFPGPQLLFEQNVLISITGGDFTPTLNDEPVPLWQPLLIRKNTILHFPKWQQGARCYIAIHGGFCIDSWLGSYSTNFKAGAGGKEGRKFEKDDVLPAKESHLYFAGWMKPGRDLLPLHWRADTGDTYHRPGDIAFIEGNEFSHLLADAKQALLEEAFTIKPLSDRMGYRLQGPALTGAGQPELVSSGVSFGTMQLLPSGDMIILMADHQTTGGYPRLGHVLSVDLPKLAQLSPGDTIRFSKTTVADAEKRLLAQQQHLNVLQAACLDQLNRMTCKG